jgi:hypothetical protein
MPCGFLNSTDVSEEHLASISNIKVSSGYYLILSGFLLDILFPEDEGKLLRNYQLLFWHYIITR